jgi:hypothetical protein
MPNALSFGFSALVATGSNAATNDHARVSGSVMPAKYSAATADRMLRKYDANSAFS